MTASVRRLAPRLSVVRVAAILLCLASSLLPSRVQCNRDGWLQPDFDRASDVQVDPDNWDISGAEDPGLGYGGERDALQTTDSGGSDEGDFGIGTNEDGSSDGGYGDNYYGSSGDYGSDEGYDDREYGSGGGYDDGEYGSGGGYDDGEYGSGGGYDDGEYGSGGEYYDGVYGSGGGYDDGEYGYGGGYDDGEYGSGGGYDDGEYGYGGGYDDGEYGYGGGYDDGEYGSGGGYDDGEYGYGGGYDDGEYSSGGGYDDGEYGSGGGYDDGEYGSGGGYDNGEYGSGGGYDDGDYGYGESLDDFDYEFGGDDDNDEEEFPYRRRYGRRNRYGLRQEYDRVLTRRSTGESSLEDTQEPEFDDASVNPEDIPSGYFGQETASSNRMSTGRYRPAISSGNIDFPGFRVVIGSRESKEWWKYDRNVCLHKELLRPSEPESADADMTMYSISCRDESTTSYICNVTQWDGSSTTSQGLTYTCCSGYTRLAGDNGCPRKIIDSPTLNLSFGALLRQQGYSQKIIDLFSTVLANNTSKQWTVFVPAKAALDAALRKVDFDETGTEPVPEWFVRTMLNHFSQPARSTQSMKSGQLLPTMAKSAGGIFITKTKGGEVLANCRPIVKANQPFNRYSIVHFTSSVLDIQQNSLYQLMVKQLETKVSPETARKLLAPLKSILTGSNSKPLTVFMHLPSRDELDSSCYANNLRTTIFKGAECNGSISSGSLLRTTDGKLRRVRMTPGGLVIGSDKRVLISTDHMASNGVLHLVNVTEPLTGFANEVTRRLKSSDLFKPLFSGESGTTNVVLMPPHNGSYSYANTSARWENAAELAKFGRRYILSNATALNRGVRLPMLDGTARDFVQLYEWQPSLSLYGPRRPVKHQFVDCVRIGQTKYDCSGAVYFLLKGELPDFTDAPTTLNYLSRSEHLRMTHRIVQFALDNNVTDLASQIDRQDSTLVLLNDTDMHRLTGGLLARRREPTHDQMMLLINWFARYFVSSRRFCAAKSVQPFVSVPAFRIDRRPCRSIICAFHRRVNSDWKRVQLRRDGHVIVREGFLLSGRALP